MVTVLFRSRLASPKDPAYDEWAPKIFELAKQSPGFVSFRMFEGEDGDRLSVIEFDSLEAVDAWREHPEHLEAQKLGQASFYSEYHLQVCEQVRSYSFEDGERTVHIP